MASSWNMNVEIIQRGQYTDASGDVIPILNRFVYSSTSSPVQLTNTELNQLAADWEAVLTASWTAAFPSLYVAIGQTIRQLDDTTYVPFDRTSNTLTGSVADAGASNQAVYMQLKSLFRGRKYQGAKHFGPVAEGQVTAGELTAGAQTLWAAVRTALQANVTSTARTWFQTIMSQSLSQVATNPVTIIATVIREILVNKPVGTMRHRRGPRQTF